MISKTVDHNPSRTLHEPHKKGSPVSNKYLKYSCDYAQLWQVSKMISENAAAVDETFADILMTVQEQRAAY
jgi:hypothetical protein